MSVMVRKQAGSGVRGHRGILFTEGTQGRHSDQVIPESRPKRRQKAMWDWVVFED